MKNEGMLDKTGREKMKFVRGDRNLTKLWMMMIMMMIGKEEGFSVVEARDWQNVDWLWIGRHKKEERGAEM